MRPALHLLAMLLLAQPPLGQAHLGPVAPRLRVIVDNGLSGDPDGLFQLPHLLLSPSVIGFFAKLELPG